MITANITTNISVERDFLGALWGQKPDDSYVLLWQLEGKRSHWFESADKAADFVSEKPRADLYVGVALSEKNLGPNKRGKAEQVLGVAGLWADVDIQSTAHSGKKRLPPDQASAQAVIDKCGLAPTVLIHSGHGLQAWWLFTEPWIFSSPEERKRFAALSQSWQELLGRHARGLGFEIDSVGDLARVLRVPGTTNKKIKEEPVQVRTLKLDGPRYTDWNSFESLVTPSLAPTMPTAKMPMPVATNGTAPLRSEGASKLFFSKFHSLRECDKEFAKTWDHKRELADSSSSGYELALANHAVDAGWGDAEIEALIIEHRRRWEPEKVDKAERPDYLARTIAKAKARGGAFSDADFGLEGVEAVPGEENAGEDGENMIAAPADVSAAALTRLQQILQAPGLKKVIRRGDECESTYELHFSNVFVPLDDITNSLRVSRSLAHAGIRAQVPENRKWRGLALFNNIILAADVVKTVSAKEETVEWIDAYLRRGRLVEFERVMDRTLEDDKYVLAHIKNDYLIMRDQSQRVYLPLAGLVAFVDGRLHQRVSQKVLGGKLSQLGFKSMKIQRAPRGECSGFQKQLWRSPKGWWSHAE